MAKINDGGVKIVYVRPEIPNRIRLDVVSELYPDEQYTFVIDSANYDKRVDVEQFLLKQYDMLPTWSWANNVGQFAHKRNLKCSTNFSITRKR